MQFDTTYLTEAGRSLATGTLGGLDKIQFTRAVASSHDYSATPVNDLKKLTSIEDVQQTVDYSRIIKKDDTTLTMRVDFPSKDVTTAYSLYTVGFYARPENGDEILYGVLPSSLPDYIVAYDGKSNLNDSFQTDTTVSDADNVLITVSQAGSLNEADLDAIFASKHIATVEDIKDNLPDDIAKTSEDNTFTGTNTFEKDPVDAAGDPYVTGAGAIAAAQGHFAQASESGGVTIDGVELGVDTAGKLKYGDDLVLMANKPQAPGFTVEMDFSVGQPQWTVTLPKIDGGASIVSSTVQYRKSGDTDWTSIQSAVSTLTGHVTGLTGNSEYEFQAFVTNYAGDSPYSEVMTVKTMDDRFFGASWDMSSDPKLTRTDAAVGLVAGINGAQNDFDTVGPWAKMDKTITDDKGNSFVRIPKLYIKKTQTDKLATWQVSLSKIDDSWYLPKCFWDFTNQKELDYVDVGRYEGTISSGKLQSKSGVMATVSQSIGTFRTDAKANGTGYQLLDVHVIDVWQVLFVIEFATINSQSIMNGISSGSQVTNGSGTNHAGSSGFLSPTGAMDYRGIENLYGNIFQFADGVNMASTKPWVCDDSSKYQSDLFAAPYTSLNYSVAATGYSEQMGLDTNHPFAQFATKTGGSESTYYSDYNYTPSGNCVALYGGDWNRSGGDGVFCWHLYESSSGLFSDFGSRLVKKALA
ncbi:fibronectin type III domain-containing protein [Levilactobacillus yonginensis]|uniref:fibronectin type III domain-containing protein n=1 Tax=Levilactobacillus yonginensis TaxID=1054041 RepID=UPI00345D10E3